MAQNILVGHKLLLTIQGRKQDGTEASVPPQPIPQWRAAPPGIVQLTRAADGMTCEAMGVSVGSTTIGVSAGGGTLSASYDITVQPDVADTIIIVGEPIP